MFKKFSSAVTALLVAAGVFVWAVYAPGGAKQTQAAPDDTAARTGQYGSHETYMRVRVNGTDIEGDVRREKREGQIEVLSFEHSVTTAREAGSGLATGRRQYQPLLVRKRIDKASPLLMKALTNNEVAEVSIEFYRPNPTGDGTEELFYTVQLRNARVSSVQMVQEEGQPPMEEISFVFHTITWTYTNGGVTHEDTWSQQR